METPTQFDPVDGEDVRRWASLSAGMRIQTLLDARALALGLMRGRLRRTFPALSTAELNMKLIEELQQLDA